MDYEQRGDSDMLVERREDVMGHTHTMFKELGF